MSDVARREKWRYWSIAIACIVVVSGLSAAARFIFAWVVDLIDQGFSFLGALFPIGDLDSVLIGAWIVGLILTRLLTPFGLLLVAYFVCIRGAFARVIGACGRCAASGYDFMDLTPEADGCTVCPECGGAWRVHGPATES